jgi:hypothetical protein
MPMSRVPIVAALLCSISCGSEAIPPLPAPPPRLLSSADRLVGCYETTADLDSPRRSAPLELPQAFYLTGEVYSVVHIDGFPVPLRRVRQAESYPAEGFWRLIAPETIQVTWTNGFENVRATLRPGSTDEAWRGSKVYTDDGPTVRGAFLSVRRVNNSGCAGSR